MTERLFAYLSYKDAPAAITWLEALGLTAARRQDGDDGSVVHCEMRLGDVVLMVASNDTDYQVAPLVGQSTGSGLYLLVEDVDAMYQAAAAAGGVAVFEPEDTEWGARRARVLDLEGREWTFGTYEPGADW